MKILKDWNDCLENVFNNLFLRIELWASELLKFSKERFKKIWFQGTILVSEKKTKEQNLSLEFSLIQKLWQKNKNFLRVQLRIAYIGKATKNFFTCFVPNAFRKILR